MTTPGDSPAAGPRGSHRLEGLTDGSFAFALTLLVIGSARSPESVADLVAALKAVPAFLASATLLLVFWRGHVTWSRRFGIDDGPATVLTGLLILTVLIYVYPLRLVAGLFFAWLTRGFLPAPAQVFSLRDLPLAFLIYGLGFMAMCACLALLYRYSQKKAALLALTADDLHDARSFEVAHWLLTASGALSVALSLMPSPIGYFAGFPYMLLPICMPLYARRRRRP